MFTVAEGHWYAIRDADPRRAGLHRRHYSARQGPKKQPHFVGPGGKLVLLTSDGRAVFAWRYSVHRRDGQQGVECTVFRNEGPVRSSDLIREACALAWQRWPGMRLFTFVDPRKVASSNPGWCFIVAGWRRLKERTKRGLRILECLPCG